MNKPTSDPKQEIIRNKLQNPRQPVAGKAGQLAAEIHRCGECGVWWGSSEGDAPQLHEAVRLIQQQAHNFPWVDYRGWQRANGTQHCPACSAESAVCELALYLDGEGRIRWPEGEPQAETPANPFAAYVTESERIGEHVDYLSLREKQQDQYAAAYSAEIADIREEMAAMRDAFKSVLTRYQPILPPGWRVTGDYDKWIKGQACAGFLHGELQPDISLMIGGRCHTVADIEMEMDRLYGYVCELAN